MKTFRCPFWQTRTSKFYVSFTIIMSVIGIPFIYLSTYSVWGTLIFLVIWSLTCFPIYFTQYFYVVLTDDQLILRNSIYTFWHKEYFYKDITKVEIKPSINVYIKVYTKSSKKFIWSYVIDLVAPEDFDELMDILKAKGITVETEGLDIHFPNRKSRKSSIISNYDDTKVRIFRQSLWNTSLVKKNLTITFILTMLFAPVILITMHSVWICLGFVFFCYSLFPLYFTRHFYVMLFADKLVVRNGVYATLRKEYLFKDIAKVKITCNGNVYLQVFTKMQEDIPKHYCIDLVAPKDYKILVDMIRAKDIVVETENIADDDKKS